MKLKYCLRFLFCLFVLIMYSCGLVENNKKKEFAKKLFEIYPKQLGDEPHDIRIKVHFDKTTHETVRDTYLIVKNGDKYYQINACGERIEGEYIVVRR